MDFCFCYAAAQGFLLKCFGVFLSSGIFTGGSRSGLLPGQRVHRWLTAHAGNYQINPLMLNHNHVKHYLNVFCPLRFLFAFKNI